MPFPWSTIRTATGKSAFPVVLVDTDGNVITGAGGGGDGLTDAELRASAVPVSLASVPTHAVTQSGTWTVALSDVSGGALPVSIGGTVAVSGPLTDTQLRATAVPVSVASLPSHAVTGPLTDTELRATAVPVSVASLPTTAVTGPLTDTQLRASAVPVSVASVPTHAVTQSGTWSVSTVPGTPVNGAKDGALASGGLSDTPGNMSSTTTAMYARVPSGKVWLVTEIRLTLVDNSATPATMVLFGSQTQPATGFRIRVLDTDQSTVVNTVLSEAKSNAQLIGRMGGDRWFTSAASGSAIIATKRYPPDAPLLLTAQQYLQADTPSSVAVTTLTVHFTYVEISV